MKKWLLAILLTVISGIILHYARIYLPSVENCVSFDGSWQSTGIKDQETITFEQKECEITGYTFTGGYDHKYRGSIDGNTGKIKMTRTDIKNCPVEFDVSIELLDNGHMKRLINYTDGSCGVNKHFANKVLYEKR